MPYPSKAREVSLMLKAIHAQESKASARQKAQEVVKKLQGMRLEKAAGVVSNSFDETLGYYEYPSRHWRHIRTNNPLERLNRGIRRRTRVLAPLWSSCASPRRKRKPLPPRQTPRARP
jgi:transposase-like protein